MVEARSLCHKGVDQSPIHRMPLDQLQKMAHPWPLQLIFNIATNVLSGSPVLKLCQRRCNAAAGHEQLLAVQIQACVIVGSQVGGST